MESAATTRPVRSRTGAATQLTSGLDSRCSTAMPRSRTASSAVRSSASSVMLSGVMPVSSMPSRRASSSGPGRAASSILPTDVQWAGSLRPAAETIRTAWVESTLAMKMTSVSSRIATWTVSPHVSATCWATCRPSAARSSCSAYRLPSW